MGKLLKKFQPGIGKNIDSIAPAALLAVLALSAAGYVTGPGAEGIAAARFGPLLAHGTGNFWGDVFTMAVTAWFCLRWASGIDDVKTIKPKRKRSLLRRILLPWD